MAELEYAVFYNTEDGKEHRAKYRSEKPLEAQDVSQILANLKTVTRQNISGLKLMQVNPAPGKHSSQADYL